MKPSISVSSFIIIALSNTEAIHYCPHPTGTVAGGSKTITVADFNHEEYAEGTNTELRSKQPNGPLSCPNDNHRGENWSRESVFVQCRIDIASPGYNDGHQPDPHPICPRGDGSIIASAPTHNGAVYVCKYKNDCDVLPARSKAKKATDWIAHSLSAMGQSMKQRVTRSGRGTAPKLIQHMIMVCDIWTL